VKARITFVEVTNGHEKTVKEEILVDKSKKPLTKGRAAKLLGRHYPSLMVAGRVLLVDTDRGWVSITGPVRTNVWLNVYVAQSSK
jgi:hypothetical protein